MGNICVIGPRASGKTTYLAALAHWPDKRRPGNDSNSQMSILPLNEESRELAMKAEDIICQGASLEPTVIGDRIQSVDDLPYYSFQIKVKKGRFSREGSVQLNVRDYPGEVFEKIADKSLGDSIHQEFIDECLMNDVTGCLIFFTAWEKGADSFYERVMNRFIDLMDQRERVGNLRLAIAMSKCERGEIWPGRLDPENDLFGLHLPKTKVTLQERLSPQNLRFYAVSTFGVLQRTDPRPNRVDDFGKDGSASVLRDAQRWKPYNMIDPLYWLSKG